MRLTVLWLTAILSAGFILAALALSYLDRRGDD